MTAAGAPILQVSRSDLLAILATACHDVDLRMGTTIPAIAERNDVVSVGLSSEADLLVVCDRQHSATTEMVFGPVETFGTHWVIWTWWARSDDFQRPVHDEPGHSQDSTRPNT